MANKIITEERLTSLFHALTGTPPARDLTEAQREARLQERAKWEIRQAKEEELTDRLAVVLGFSAVLDLAEDDLESLYRALVS